jgi:hypothetical protein
MGQRIEEINTEKEPNLTRLTQSIKFGLWSSRKIHQVSSESKSIDYLDLRVTHQHPPILKYPFCLSAFPLWKGLEASF